MSAFKLDVDKVVSDLDSMLEGTHMSPDQDSKYQQTNVNQHNQSDIEESKSNQTKIEREEQNNNGLNVNLNGSQSDMTSDMASEIDQFLQDMHSPSKPTTNDKHKNKVSDIFDPICETGSTVCSTVKLANDIGDSETSSINQEINHCRRIHCLNCDHIVLRCPNHKWNNDCDYLFFRLNVPNYEKLSKKLSFDSDYCAYACQCQWISVKQKHDISISIKDTQIQTWQCSSHA